MPSHGHDLDGIYMNKQLIRGGAVFFSHANVVLNMRTFSHTEGRSNKFPPFTRGGGCVYPILIGGRKKIGPAILAPPPSP